MITNIDVKFQRWDFDLNEMGVFISRSYFI
jgi:hypothetical protein